MPRTLEYVKRVTRLKFGKTDADLEDNLASFITDHLREICSSFPYWFLKMEPGMLVPTQFPSYPAAPAPAGTLLSGFWLDQGWLRTEPGMPYYAVHTALQQDPQSPSLWGLGEVCTVHHAKRFTNEGSFQEDLWVSNSDRHLSRGSLTAGANPGYPREVWPDTRNGITYLRFHPTPNDYFIVSVSYQLALPPWVVTGNSTTNLILQYYPRVVESIAGLVYSEWFHEPKQKEFYKRELYGDSDQGIVRSDIPNCGLLGKMKLDTDRRHIQETDEIGYYQSTADSQGRGGPYGRRPGGPYYTGPNTY